MKKVLVLAFVLAVGAAVGNWMSSSAAPVAAKVAPMSMLQHSAPANLPVQQYDAI